MKSTLGIFCSIILLWSCNRSSPDIDVFFNDLDHTLTKNEQEEIRGCNGIDSLRSFVYSKAPKVFLDKFDTLPPDITLFLKSRFTIPEFNNRRLALIIAYQTRLNKHDISFSKINGQIEDYYRLNDSLYTKYHEIEIQAQLRLAKKNYDKFHIGDTLNLLYPLEKNGSYKTVVFYAHYDKINFKDTLYLKCILLKKEIEYMFRVFGYDEFNFSLKIIEAKNKEINIVEESYTKGKVTRLPLYIYGRNI